MNPMNEKSIEFYNKLKKAVETDQLTLPSLPEVAIKIRDAVDSESNSAEEIANILTQDAAITARLLQVANSPIYRARSEIIDLQMAVTRLGTRVVRDLIITLAMKQMFQASSEILKQKFHALWLTSVEVAAISRLLANQASLNPEQAVIAGLIHNIGALPILQLAQQDEDLVNDEQALNEVIQQSHYKVGEMILKFWNFPSHFVDVVSKWHIFNREHTGSADYVDLVQVAILQSGHNSIGKLPEDWQQVPAFNQLGLDATTKIVDIEENKIKIEETRDSLIKI